MKRLFKFLASLFPRKCEYCRKPITAGKYCNPECESNDLIYRQW